MLPYVDMEIKNKKQCLPVQYSSYLQQSWEFWFKNQ